MGKELLFSITKKDLKIDYFSGSGGGGQHRNKHQNCVRLHHLDSGVIVTGQSNKERKANIREAFNNLIKHPKFIIWHNKKVREALEGKTINQKVQEAMSEDNIRVEVRKNNKWV